MSKSISIECRFNEEPLAADVLERRTWADVSVIADGKIITRSRDATSGEERTSVSIPAFPLAAWFVQNWWTILFEPKRGDAAPPADYELKAAQRDWTARHCLRAAESSLMLPRAFVYSNGPSLDLEWDVEDGHYDRIQPIRFASLGRATVERRDAEETLKAFVDQVLQHVGDIADERVKRLSANWEAILAADVSEAAFCRAAGCMGLDPYASDAWDRSLLALLESDIIDNPEDPLVEDFLEAVHFQTAPAAWSWVAAAKAGIGAGGIRPRRGNSHSVCGSRGGASAISIDRVLNGRSSDAMFAQHPAIIGYGAAQHVREQAGLTSTDAVPEVGELLKGLGAPALQIENSSHVGDKSIKGVVGWRAGERPVVKGPRHHRPDSQRFIEARALYHAAFGCERGSRLLTTSYTWDQQASRAFAAELLAPREAVANALPPLADRDDLQKVADKFRVSTFVIGRQAQNLGLVTDND